ncbi:TonB-dependent receptor [Acidithiobacillus sp.]|uniref:TonB-dependent receptor domain-containing protein n=1 Tax=Acidithiobacillus sp. TaxID=1872118 RepID=UPI0025BBE10F|nr:TonB-dependent receptor [Acidithiobacillus sp.]
MQLSMKALRIAVVLSFLPGTALAESQSLGTVTAVDSTPDGGGAPSMAHYGPQSAPALAPGKAPLSATEPSTIIDSRFIDNAVLGDADFNQIANLAPGVSGGFNSNGPGIGESKLNLRGFGDGEFNMTYDGIPFGDTNDFTHHSTAYFPASTIDRVVVERGPGNADNLGYATFGGSVNLFSPNPSATPSGKMGFLYGSDNTLLFKARANSGALPWLGGARYLVNYQHNSSDGYQSFSPVKGDNVLFKMLVPLGENTLVTLLTTFNWNTYYQSDATKGQLTEALAQRFGKDFALGNNPLMANYYAYNRTRKHTGFSYLRLQSTLGEGFSLDDTVYYYFYHNSTLSSSAKDPLAGLGAVILGNGKKSLGIPGYDKLNGYWLVGNILRLHKDWSFGRATAGLWVETGATQRGRVDYDLLTGAPNYDQKPVPGILPGINNIQFDQHSGTRNLQPFAQFAWRPMESLTITPGIKYLRFTRSMSALINQNSRLPAFYQQSYHSTLPFLTVNYRLNPENSAYLQFAKGFLAPPLDVLQTANGEKNRLQPETTTNYQLGFNHQSEHWVWDADLYYIDFNNRYAIDPNSPLSDPYYYNQGGVIYKGVEGEATYALGNGLAIYANGSINSAKSKATNLTISGAPRYTAAAALLYDMGPYHLALVYKRTGRQYVRDDAQYPLAPLNNLNLKLGYDIVSPLPRVKKLRLGFDVYNLTDERGAYKAKVKSAQPSPGDTFNFQAPRSFYGSVTASF